jgi:hypothetical protein
MAEGPSLVEEVLGHSFWDEVAAAGRVQDRRRWRMWPSMALQPGKLRRKS